jgi:hypothetical protein
MTVIKFKDHQPVLIDSGTAPTYKIGISARLSKSFGCSTAQRNR